MVTYFKVSLATMSHEQLFHECKSARVLCRSIRLLNLTKSIFWTSLEALSSSWLHVHHQRRREVLLSSDKRVRIAYLLECCAGLFRPWSRAGAGCMEAQAGVSALQHARLRCIVGCSDGSGEREWWLLVCKKDGVSDQKLQNILQIGARGRGLAWLDSSGPRD
jgi:hypothetical protein